MSRQKEGHYLHSGTWDSLAPLIHPLYPHCSPQSLGRATLAEAKFTFLCGAWGCVQSPGSTEPRIVVMCGPDRASTPPCSPEGQGPSRGLDPTGAGSKRALLESGPLPSLAPQGPLWSLALTEGSSQAPWVDCRGAVLWPQVPAQRISEDPGNRYYCQK